MSRDPSPPALTPSAFPEALAARIDALQEAGSTPVRLRGIPVKTGGTGRVYGGFVYASIRDPQTTEAIEARVPERLAGGLERGREAVLVGLMRYRSRRGEVKPEFRVDGVEALATGRLPAKDELIARWERAITRPKAAAQVALRVDRPRVRVITGVGSVAVDDIRAQLREVEVPLGLDVRRVSMAAPEEVARAVRQSGDAHLVVVTRGGGPEVHDLDADRLIEAVASSPVPVAVALGHASDDLVLNRVADACFPTPTALGVWLRNGLEGKRDRERQVKEAELLGRAEGPLRELEVLRQAGNRLVW